MWQLNPSDVDFTVMKIMVQGEKGGKRLRYTWDLFDRRDPSTGVHSMARTTGYTATVTARLIAQGLFTQTGIVPPERIGMDPACMTFILNGLADRGVIYRESEEKIYKKRGRMRFASGRVFRESD